MHLVRRNEVQVYHTQLFLEETITSYESQGATGEWRDHLRFALDICNGGIFLRPSQLWHEEIVRGRRTSAMRLLPTRRHRDYGSSPDLVRELRQLSKTGDLSAEYRDSMQERAELFQKKKAQRAIAGDMRRDIENALRDRRLTVPLSTAKFEDTISQALIETGKQIMRQVDARRAVALGEMWAKRPADFPFYTAFVEGLIYHQFHAMFEHNKKIDVNAQADYEQLAYLLWADVFVSNDAKFQRDAFDTLWKPRGKHMETVESFASLLATRSAETSSAG